MTHWIKSAIERVMARFARKAQTTERRGPSRKMKGVSTVEYALILVAVVGIVSTAIALLDTEFTSLFTTLEAGLDAAETKAKETAPPVTP